jgi:hypothetical protein
VTGRPGYTLSVQQYIRALSSAIKSQFHGWPVSSSTTLCDDFYDLYELHDFTCFHSTKNPFSPTSLFQLYYPQHIILPQCPTSTRALPPSTPEWAWAASLCPRTDIHPATAMGTTRTADTAPPVAITGCPRNTTIPTMRTGGDTTAAATGAIQAAIRAPR